MHKNVEKALRLINKDEATFIFLMGSYARNKQTVYSDVDIKVALKDGLEGHFDTFYDNDVYLSIKYDSTQDLEEYFHNPALYVAAYPSFKDMVVLYEEGTSFQDFQNKLLSINYFEHFHDQIISFVNKEVIEWVEEVNKSLNGLLLKDDDKLLAGLHGLTYGILHVLCVSEGIFYSDKGILDTMKKHFKNKDSYKLIERAFGVKKHSLQTRTLNGLRLFLECLDMMKHNLTEDTKTQLIIVKKNIVKTLINYQ